MRTTKKILSLILAFVLVLGLLPTSVFATETNLLTLEELRAQYGAITVEAYTLGQGFLLEPTLYAKEDGKSVGAITVDLLQSKGITYQGSESYFSGFEFDDTLAPEYPDYIDPSMFGCEESGDGDGYLSEFDYSTSSGWVFTINHWFSSYGADNTYPGTEINDYNSGEPVVLGDVIRWHFTVAGWGADCGIPGNAMAEMMGGNLITQEEKTDLVFSLAAINDYYGNLDADNVYETALAVAADPLASADDIAAQEATLAAYIEETFFAEEEPEAPRTAQDVSDVLNATMAQMAATVTAPAFGTSAGEWTVFSLARGGYYAKDNAYFATYYTHIVETVNTLAASVDMNGALDKTKSTENSRLIFALSAIGKDATAVGNWNLITPYEDFDWIKKQGTNGVIFALLALDSNNYATADTTIRQQCVDYLLDAQHDDGGWSLMNVATLESNVDVTAMTLQALYPYRNQANVAAACEEAITWLSEIQNDNGGYLYGSEGETSESCAQVIVALSTWGINPDTDPRFVKNSISALDNLLSYYVEDEAAFMHHKGNAVDDMATDQACYALVAYDRLMNNQKSLYDCSDVVFDSVTPSTDEMVATLGLPTEINPGAAFNATVSINKWDNEAAYKLIDMIVNIPEGVSVTDVTAGSRLEGGEISWNVEVETGKLRIVYFDANENTDLTITGEEFPAELFTIGLKADSVAGGSKVNVAISGMSVKLTSDSEDDASLVVVNTDTAKDTTAVVVGISFSAKCLYTGDDVDIITSTKKAVAVAITGIAKGAKLTFKDGETEIVFQYSAEISAKTNVSSYVALVDAEIEMEKFVDAKNFTIGAVSEDAITFGDVNNDGVVNAQDALAAVDTWLRKGEEPTDLQILTMNVNGDRRINTYDALGIVEAFLNKTDYIVVTKAATITENQ